MRIIAVLLLVLPVMLMAEEVELPLPRSVEKAIKNHVKEIDKANEELEKAVYKADAKLIKALKDEIDDIKDDVKSSYDGFKAALTDKQIIENNGIDKKVRELAALNIKLAEIVGEKEKVDLFGDKKKKPKTMSGGKIVDVSAGWGKEIDSVKKGQSIMVKYVDGKWRSPHEDETENPEETNKPHLKLALYARVNKDNRFEMLKIINNTSEIFTYEFEQDYQMIMLAPQINTSKVPNWNIMHQNTGNVKYQVGFSK